MALRCVLCFLPHVPKGTETQWPTVVTSSQHPFMRCLPFPGSLHHTPDGTFCNHFPNKPLTPETASGGHQSKALATSRGCFNLCLACSAFGMGFSQLPGEINKSCICPQGRKTNGWKVGKIYIYIVMLGPTCPLFKAGGMKFPHIKF